MKIMVGIDLHSNNALCGLMDETGRRLVHKKLPCDLAAILQLLKPYQESIATIAVESTYNWYWLVDGLQDHGYQVKLANPARMQPYSGMKYSDDVSDAYFLAELSRLNLLPTGHLYDRKKQQTNPVIATRSLACKLAKAAWHVMTENVPYDAERVFGPAKKSDFGETGREPAKGSGPPSQRD